MAKKLHSKKSKLKLISGASDVQLPNSKEESELKAILDKFRQIKAQQACKEKESCLPEFPPAA